MTTHQLPRLLLSTLPTSAMLAALLVAGCATTPGGNRHPLDSDGSVADPCADTSCAADQHCELVWPPCAPGGACEPVPVCVPDATECTVDACGPQPPTLPCADGSPSQACERGEQGDCGWQQLECPHVGDPCVDCEPCPIPEFGECRWTEVGVCSQVSLSCV